VCVSKSRLLLLRESSAKLSRESFFIYHRVSNEYEFWITGRESVTTKKQQKKYVCDDDDDDVSSVHADDGDDVLQKTEKGDDDDECAVVQ